MVQQLHIEPVVNGFIVSFGCQKLVFEDVDELTHEIANYYKNPEMVEKQYRKNQKPWSPFLHNYPQPAQAPNSGYPMTESATEAANLVDPLPTGLGCRVPVTH